MNKLLSFLEGILDASACRQCHEFATIVAAVAVVRQKDKDEFLQVGFGMVQCLNIRFQALSSCADERAVAQEVARAARGADGATSCQKLHLGNLQDLRAWLV